MNDANDTGPHSTVRLGTAEVDPRRLVVRSAGIEHRLAPKHMAVFVELANHAPAVVSRAELLNAVWPRASSMRLCWGMPSPRCARHSMPAPCAM